MPDRILLNPENRGLATSGSNDFSLYGAQPDPAVLLRPDHSDGSPGETASSSAASPAPQADRSEAPVSGADVQQPQNLSLAPEAASSPPAPAALHEAAPSSAEAATTGSLIPLAFAAAAFPANPTLAESNAPTPDAPTPIQPPLAAAPAEAISLAAPTLEAAAQAVPAPVDAVTIPVVADAPGTVPETSEILADPVNGAFATLGPIDAAADSADDVQDLLGSDPAGGIATLVSLVSVSDVLPVTEAENDAGEAAEDLGNDLLDSLAADPLESNLLGTDADDDGPAAGLLTTPASSADVDLPGGLG